MRDAGRKPPERNSRQRIESLAELDRLHKRHPGITESVCRAFAEAAAVCLSRHHVTPKDFRLGVNVEESIAEVQWREPTERALRAWNNADDATRDGAYILALAAAECKLGLIAVERAETLTGADYYLGLAPADDLERAYRLEVSGVDRGGEPDVRARLVAKVRQAKAGKSNLPAIACVVGFLRALIKMETMEE